MKRVTASLPEEMVEEIDDCITGTESRSEWIRDAAREKLGGEDVEKGAA